MVKVFVNKRKVITTTSDEVTEEVVTEAIKLHMSKLVKNYVESEDMYLSQHEVLKMTKKIVGNQIIVWFLITQNTSSIRLQAIKLACLLKSSTKTKT